MRLIDADALIEDIKHCLWDWDSVDGIKSSTVLKQTITDINNAPTIKLSGDLISRADAIEAVCNAQCELDVPHYPQCDQVKYCDEIKALMALPSADAVSREDYHNLLMASNDIDRALRQYQAKEETDVEPKWNCTANFVAEHLDKLKDMSVSEKLKLIQGLLGVEFKEENLNYKHTSAEAVQRGWRSMSEEIYEITKDTDGVDCYIKRGELVRCKDCKQRRVEGDCTHYYYCDIIGSICGDNEYCSFGERREL